LGNDQRRPETTTKRPVLGKTAPIYRYPKPARGGPVISTPYRPLPQSLDTPDNGQPDRLIGLSTPVAATAELHETIHDSGVMKMRPMAGIALEPGKPVTFSPGGYHVMLMGLKNLLKAGDRVPLTLTFEHAYPITVTVKVEAIGAAGTGHEHGTMDDMPGQMGHTP